METASRKPPTDTLVWPQTLTARTAVLLPGDSTTLTIVFTGTATSATATTLACSDPSLLVVPNSVTLQAGKNKVSFSVTALAGAATATSVTVTAFANAHTASCVVIVEAV